MLDLLHQLTDWFIGFAESDWAVVVLAIGSFLESTISPVPIDPLLIPMGVLQPNFAIFFAVVALISSVLGALVGSLGVLIFLFGDSIQIFVEEQFKNLSIAFGLGVVTVGIVAWLTMKFGLVNRLRRRE